MTQMAITNGKKDQTNALNAMAFGVVAVFQIVVAAVVAKL